jgi:hypothetical protein
MDLIITNEILYLLTLETAKILNNKQDEFNKIKWNDGEANLDTEYSILACNCCEDAWKIIQNDNIELKNINIKCKIPDINIKFINSNDQYLLKKIELKSSKKCKIPGSTINKLDINQPIIYCLRPNKQNKEYLIRCSQYHHIIQNSNIDLFQDRTPRPIIDFNKMSNNNNFKYELKQNWIQHYAKCALNRIDTNIQCQISWQDKLILEIKNNIIKEFIKNTSIEDYKELKTTILLENLKIN